MLMHTKVFGRYNGPEEVMYRTPRYTEINVIDNYAPTAKADVTIVDADGKPVADAKVEFKVYNYAEFYTVASKQTDADGKTFLTAGKGDMLVWASKDGKFGYSKLSFGQDNALTVKLDKNGRRGLYTGYGYHSSDGRRQYARSDSRTTCGEQSPHGFGGLYPQCLRGYIHDG